MIYIDGRRFGSQHILSAVGVDEEGRSVMSQSVCTTYNDQPMVYENHVIVPVHELMTEFGLRRLHVVTSCFWFQELQQAFVCELEKLSPMTLRGFSQYVSLPAEMHRHH